VGLDALIERMEADLAGLAPDDGRRHFHATYLRTTRAVADEIRGGGFEDADWLERWDVAFADLYLDALAADQGTGKGQGTVPGPWRVAFDTARRRTDLPPLRLVLLGMNAHINYDLPQALLAVIPPADLDDPAVRASRARDHKHIDDVLAARIGAEDDELEALGPRSLLDRLLTPLNRFATRRFLTEAREKVWRNTIVLDRARRAGEEEYRSRLSELERLSTSRLVDLTRPGQVLLRLARLGFGVLLPDPHRPRR
jgi:hypothetical protein